MNVFDKDDYNSNDGMLTSIWGPSLWHTLHVMSFNYPVKPTKIHKDNYYNFLISLQSVLPCIHCRNNFFKNLKNCKFSKKIFKNRETFSKFIYDLHNEVNKMLGKKCSISYKEVQNRYEHFRSRCIDKKKKTKYEDGCTKSLYGNKSKCVINIVPKSSKRRTFLMSPKCKIKKRI